MREGPTDDGEWEPHWEADDDYEKPEITGVPVEGERATIVYASRRSGEPVTRSGTVTDVHDETFGSELHVDTCELTIEGADGTFQVWLGGGYHPEWTREERPEGYEPAMVFTRNLQSNPGGEGYHWRENRLGHVLEARFPRGTTLEIHVEGAARTS